MPLCQNRIACRSVAKIQRTRVINAHMLLRDVYQVVTALDRFLMIGAKVLGIFVLKERKFQGMKVLGTFALEERKFQGANVPWNESSTGTKVPSVDFLLPWTFVHGSEFRTFHSSALLCRGIIPLHFCAEEWKVRNSHFTVCIPHLVLLSVHGGQKLLLCASCFQSGLTNMT